MLSPCLLFSLQPRSFLSPPEKGNHSLGSSTMEQALVFAFCSQQPGATGGEGGLCPPHVADKALPGEGNRTCLRLSPSQHSAGDQSKPLLKHTNQIRGLGDETRSNPDMPWSCLMLPPCSCCRAGHNFPGPGKRRMQARGFRYLPNPLGAEPSAQSQPQGLYQSKQLSTQAPSQLQNTAGGKDCPHHSLAQQVSGEHSLHGKNGVTH